MNIYPYVYRIDHPSGEFYIGYRAANKVPASDDFGIRYKTSSKNLSYPFEEYRQTILAEFYLPSGKTDAYDFEQLTIFEHWGEPNLANKSCYYGKARMSMTGRKHSSQVKARMSASAKGRQFSEEHKLNLSEAWKNRPGHSDETRMKISATTIGRKKSEETRRRMSEGQKGRVVSEETRKRMAESARRRKR